MGFVGFWRPGGVCRRCLLVCSCCCGGGLCYVLREFLCGELPLWWVGCCFGWWLFFAEYFDDAFFMEAAAAGCHFYHDVWGVGFFGSVEEFEFGVSPDADLDAGFYPGEDGSGSGGDG